MDKLLQRVVSLLLTVAMLFSFVPGTVFAESGAESEIHKLTSADELVTGQYVLLCENGQAVGVLDGTWLTAAGTDEAAILSGPDAALVWTLDVNSDGVSLTDSNGVTVAPKGGNTNGIQAGDYRWAVTFENGAFQFSGVGEDTTRLASNTGSDNKFRAYKNDTINGNPNGYPSNFTLYQVPAGSVTPEPDPETPVSITIAEALAAASGTADLRVTGVVTLVDGQNIYLQDTTGAICARGAADGIALGDTVTATGTRGDYNGLPQLNNATFEKGEGMTLEAKTTTIDALTTADICTYVKLEHLTVTEVYDNNGAYSQPNITVTDGTNTIQIYKAVVDKQQDGSWAVAVDDTITVSAAVSVYNTTLQLRNTNANEIVKESGQPVEPQGPIADGDRVVIYNPAYNKALSATYNGFYNNGTDVTLSDGQLTGFSEADVWTVKDNGDGSFSFAYNGQNIGMGDSFSSMPLGEKNDRWVLEEAGDGLYYIKNTVRNSYMEWYADKNNWSSYGKIGAGSEGLFALTFYKVTGEIPDPEPGQGALEDGDQVVIYNLSAKGVLAGPDGNETSPSILSAPATEAETITEISNGARVFTVEKNGDYYRFKTEYDGYLCSNGTGNNAFYSQQASEDADWTLAEYNGGYTLESRTAKFNGKYSQFLEYFSSSYKTYSMNKVTDKDIFTFRFYPVAASVSVTKGVVNMPKVDFGTPTDANVGMDYSLFFAVDSVFGVQSIQASYEGKTQEPKLDEAGYSITIPAAELTEEKTIQVTVSGTDKEGVAFEGTVSIQVKDEPVITEVFPAANSQTGEELRPQIGVKFANAGKNPSVTMTVNGEEVSPKVEADQAVYTPDADLAQGRTSVTVKLETETGKTVERSWNFTVGEAEYQLYFGQLHSHTNYSDGSGTLQDALNYVKNLHDNEQVDFVAFTDHSNYFDKSGEANPEGALYDMSLATEYSRQLWAEYKNTVAEFNASQSDVLALAGFEMTWSGGPGHMNTFNTPGIVSRNNTTLNNKTGDAGLQAYYKLLSQPEGVDAISQFNHPGTTFGTFADFAYYDAVIDSRVYLLEVGNGEGAIGSGGYFPSYQYYTMALDKGWHVAPTNNQDNHKGKWGNANDARDVILADALTEESIYEAIRAYRVYASEDKNLEISYALNDQVMGSIIEEVPETVEIDVSVYDPDTSDSISKVEVVVNSGTVAHSWTPAEIASGTMECAIPADYSYYFIRVTQGDGDVAVTAPVWVGETMKLGVSSVECGTATPVTGEALTLTTSLFNSELSAAAIKSVTYSCDGQVLDTQKDLGTLDASSTKEVKWDYTPTVARVMTITVAVELEVDGISYTYTKDISLDVQDASKLVYIGIDASHYNEYVAGNYKDSMGNFGALAADYSVRTVQLNTSEQLLEACANEGGKYKALILTAPSRRDGNALRDPYATYSDEEIQAIQKFNAAGGVVVLAGWSDYYESYAAFDAADHMAAQQNKVLEALGSSLRIGDDATNDDTLNGGQTQRLYFSTYNWDSFLMDGVEYDAEHPNDNMYSQLFSQYGGASVYVVDENGNPTSELPATVSPVVYGHATTYSTDSDKDGLGGEAMPKYPVAEGDNRLMVLASEQLEGKGMILVSGAAFMSNFEVQAEVEDSSAEKNYSNYNICANLVSSLNPVEISPIAQVQAEELEGVKFTIEGVVTSNASGYDKNTAFFDCIYLQDDTAGVNAFPVAGNYKVGDVVRITGTTSSYQGERQINVMQIEKIGEQSAPAPKQITASQLNDGSVLGSLVTLKGTVESFAKENGLVQTIMVKDAAGNLGRVFIDGYIDTAEDVKDLEEGCEITVTGLASYDNTFNAPEGPFPRIRVRDRSDVICTASQQPETSPKPEETPKPGTDLALDIQQGIVNVPEALKNTAFNTAEKIKNELYRVAATVLSGLKAENMLVYDITLMTRNALGQWVPVDPANFPKDGVVVELPYPAGTSRDTHDFVVTHMFTEERDGHKPGDVETLQVYETETGIRFVVKSLSPIGLSWKVTEKADGGQGSGGSSGGSTNAPAATPVPVITGGAQTGDSNVILVAGAVVVLAVAALAALEVSRRTRNAQQNKTK